MKIKFNKFERVAGLFVLVALLGSMAVTIAVAVKKGWFSSKVNYTTVLTSAEGLHSGTPIHVAGLRAGSVQDVELISAQEVKVSFEVLEKFKTNIRQDSELRVVRPFIIGEKVLEITVGDKSLEMLTAGAEIPSVESFDIMEILSGRKMGPLLGSIEQLTSNLKTLLQAFADPKRTEALVKMFDRLDPLIVNLSEMSSGVTKLTTAVNKDERLEKVVVSLVSITHELDKILPLLNAQSPDLGLQMGQIVDNLNVLTTEFKKITPAIAAIAPELPQTSLRAVEALDETVVLLKALQKSFLLRGNVEEVKEEMRQPAEVQPRVDK